MWQNAKAQTYVGEAQDSEAKDSEMNSPIHQIDKIFEIVNRVH